MTIAMFALPLPPESEHWCTICAGQFKQDAIKHHQAKIDEWNKDGKPDLAWIMDRGPDEPGMVPLRVAVTTAVSPVFPQLGPVDLCWSHAPAITTETRRGLAIADGGILPPGLMRGRG